MLGKRLTSVLSWEQSLRRAARPVQPSVCCPSHGSVGPALHLPESRRSISLSNKASVRLLKGEAVLLSGSHFSISSALGPMRAVSCVLPQVSL